MSRVTKEQILEQIRELGIQENDIVFVTIDIMKVGYFRQSRENTLSDWVDILTSAVGENGAVIFAAYTKFFFRFLKKDFIFHRNSESIAGSLPNYIIRIPQAIRSLHPTNSVIALGKVVEKILMQHDPSKLSYSVMGDIIKMPQSKFVMIGTIDKRNAPQAMHYVQEDLGFTMFSPYKYLLQTFYFDGSKKKLFTEKDIGGCSGVGYRLFSPLIVNDAVKFEYVGNAFAACMPANKSYQIIKSELKKNPGIIKCDDKDCISCYGNPYYNGYKAFFFYLKLVFNLRKRFMRRLKKYKAK